VKPLKGASLTCRHCKAPTSRTSADVCRRCRKGTPQVRWQFAGTRERPGVRYWRVQKFRDH
jgi:predicted amidophosphoribosyltransferase